MKELKMYINGQFVESGNGKWIDVLNPSTEEVISRQPEGTIEDVEICACICCLTRPALIGLCSVFDGIHFPVSRNVRTLSERLEIHSPNGRLFSSFLRLPQNCERQSNGTDINYFLRPVILHKFKAFLIQIK